MFSLIITVISIALVAALALATLYYGGAAFGKGASRAEASKVVLQGQQLLGAADLYFTEHRTWPANIGVLVSGGYLKQVPVAQASGLTEALAAGSPWEMVPNSPTFYITTPSPEVCAEVNLAASLRKRGILRQAYSSLVAQCYGADANNLTTVFRKSTESPFNDPTDVATDPNPPTDPTSSDWLVQPGATPPAGGGGAGGGGGGGSGGGGIVDGGPGNGAPGAPRLSAAPAPLNFGASTVGITQSRSVVVTNTGEGAAYVNNVVAPGSFGATSDCGGLSVGDSCTLTVTFTPGSASSSSGTLVIEYQDDNTGDEYTYQLALSGSGAAPSGFANLGSSVAGLPPFKTNLMGSYADFGGARPAQDFGAFLDYTSDGSAYGLPGSGLAEVYFAPGVTGADASYPATFGSMSGRSFGLGMPDGVTSASLFIGDCTAAGCYVGYTATFNSYSQSVNMTAPGMDSQSVTVLRNWGEPGLAIADAGVSVETAAASSTVALSYSGSAYATPTLAGGPSNVTFNVAGCGLANMDTGLLSCNYELAFVAPQTPGLYKLTVNLGSLQGNLANHPLRHDIYVRVQ